MSPATTTGREPALTADVALWPPAALTLGAFTRLAVFSTDGGVTASVPAPRGGFFGVDATARPFGPFPGGVIVASSQSPDGGLLMLLVPGGDGGLVALAAPLSVAAARGVALGDFGDAGSWVFFESGSDRLHRARLHLGDGGQPAATVGAELRLPAASLGLVAAPAFGQVLVSTVAGLVAVDVVGDGGLRALDAGSGDAAVSGLAAFPLLDGGLAVLGAVPALDRFRLFAYEGGRLERLVDFEVALPDGGEPLTAGAFVDVTRAPFGQNRDGGASPDSGFPLGVVAFGEALPDGGAAVRLVPFEALAAVAGLLSGDGGTGGGPGGGAGGGPPIVEPPMGCCSGAPASASLMALAFLAWLRRFARGRSSRTLSRLEP
ncbi:MAG: hypothetical protein INH37_04410 [Myxococcaceae bacterium]|nr:hypothetical protein [Myxococcaceae bacterium]